MKLTYIFLCLFFTLLSKYGFSSDVVTKQTTTLYYQPNCPYSQRVLKYLDQHPCDIRRVNVYQNPEAQQQMKQKGLIMRVPCLDTGPCALYNADEIISWLATHAEQ